MSPKAAIPKSAATRERLFETALRLFESQGFEATTMRQIADGAGCSLGLTYRYFAAKEDLVLELYGRIAAGFIEGVATVPRAPLAERFEAAMKVKFELMSPHRSALLGLFAVALSPSSPAAVIGTRSKRVRETIRSGFREVVADARDLRRGDDIEELTNMTYLVHLMLILAWCTDRSAGLSVTNGLVSKVSQLLSLMRRFQRLPVARSTISGLISSLGQIVD